MRGAFQIVAATVFGISLVAWSTSQTAVFDQYETKVSRDPVRRVGQGSLLLPAYEKTGRAWVRLADGRTVRVKCPLTGLVSGSKVTVKREDCGCWIVTERQ